MEVGSFLTTFFDAPPDRCPDQFVHVPETTEKNVGLALFLFHDHGVVAYGSRRGVVSIDFNNAVCNHVLMALKTRQGLFQELFDFFQVPALAAHLRIVDDGVERKRQSYSKKESFNLGSGFTDVFSGVFSGNTP